VFVFALILVLVSVEDELFTEADGVVVVVVV
jgi:hypothetical protein